MNDYKKRFIDAKKEMDERIEKRKCAEEKYQNGLNKERMIELGKNDGQEFFKGMDNFITRNLEHFIYCMSKENIKPPFSLTEEVVLAFEDIQLKDDYRKSFTQTLEDLIKNSLIECTPEFCDFKVKINDKIERTYYPKIGKCAYKVKIQIDITLTFRS